MATWMRDPRRPSGAPEAVGHIFQRWISERCCSECAYGHRDRRLLVLHRVHCESFRAVVLEAQQAAQELGRDA